MGEIKIRLLLIVGIVCTDKGRDRLNDEEKYLVDRRYLGIMKLWHIVSELSQRSVWKLYSVQRCMRFMQVESDAISERTVGNLKSTPHFARRRLSQGIHFHFLL